MRFAFAFASDVVAVVVDVVVVAVVVGGGVVVALDSSPPVTRKSTTFVAFQHRDLISTILNKTKSCAAYSKQLF